MHPTDSIVKVKPWPTTDTKNQSFLIKKKIYSILHIIKRA